MALTLGAELAAAQELKKRHPLVEITSSESIADIPFRGNFLSSGIVNEFGVNTITHSSGRLCSALCYGPTSGAASRGIKYTYTDPDRLEFHTVSIELYTSANYRVLGVSLCEMTNGNIGLVYLVHYVPSTAKYYLFRRIITVEGAAVSNAEIANWNYTIYTSDPWVYTLGTNSYIMLYGKQSGANYYIYKRTSSDFVTWSAESALSIADITTTYKLSNPSLMKDKDNKYWLWFDALESTSDYGDTIKNVYYSISNDTVTWGGAVKFTSYDSYGSSGYHPVGVMKVNDIYMGYTEQLSSLHLSDKETEWPTGSEAQVLSINVATRKVYVVNYNHMSTTVYDPQYRLRHVVEVDLDTWVATKNWTDLTDPAFTASMVSTTSANVDPVHIRQEGGKVVVAGYSRVISLLDPVADTIVNYDTTPTTGNVSNVPTATFKMAGATYDDTNKRLWIRFYLSGSPYTLVLGYIDTTKETDYEWVEFKTFAGTSASVIHYGGGIGSRSDVIIDAANDRLIWWGAAAIGSLGGYKVYSIADASLIFENDWTEDDEYSMTWPLLYEGYLYCSKAVSFGPPAALCRINVLTGELTEIEMPYLTEAGQTEADSKKTAISRPCYVKDGKIAYIHYPYGVIVYDTVNGTFQTYDNTTVPGFTTNAVNPFSWSNIAFDSVNDMLVIGDGVWRSSMTGKGLVMFPLEGFIRQTQYSIGSDTGTWEFTEPATLMYGYTDYDAALAVAEGVLYALWNNQNVLTSLILPKWDSDAGTVDISSFIVGEVSTEARIDGGYASINFQASHGHLFDPHNRASLLSPLLKKGRTIKLRWGENVGGTPYWQTAGTYYVTETSLSLERGNYPLIAVRAEDRRCLWANSHIYATTNYSATPDVIIESLLGTFGNMEEAELALPAFGSTIYYQGLETTLDEIINQLCERFGYYFRFDVDGKASARLISNEAAVDHAYSDNTKLLKYTPDDRYSDFTNKVTVRGQSLDFTEVTYDEERVGAVAGTLGWWGCKADHTVWFSEDKSRRCSNPRMVIIESSASIALELAGSVKEYLVEGTGDDADKYCSVVIEAPSLMVPFLNNLVALIASAYIPDIVETLGFVVSGGITQRVGSAMSTLSTFMLCNIMGSVANYQIEVHANPIGEIRQGCQATWEDTDHQTEINATVEQVIDDPLCYTRLDCLDVAYFEGMVVTMQRRRVLIQKIAHLQDEDGDTITVLHPYSGQNISLFINTLRRKFKRGKDGYFIDEIEGWVI